MATTVVLGEGKGALGQFASLVRPPEIEEHFREHQANSGFSKERNIECLKKSSSPNEIHRRGLPYKCASGVPLDSALQDLVEER